MKLKKRAQSGREKDQQAIELLERLREKVHCENSSAARHAAFNLSWMQEDGFEILKEAMFSNASKTTKYAAAYGLRKMRGRMKKMAMGLLEEGLKHSNDGTRQVCARALQMIKEAKESAQQEPNSQPQTKPKQRRKPKFRISEISPRMSQGNGNMQRRSRRNPPHMSRFNR